ncbi:MAG: hypothetical protein ACRD0S_11790 [Acidimicrobiales bacterium]
MPISFRDIEFRTDLPDIPSAMPAAVTEGQCAHERVETMRTLVALFDLGDAVDVALPFGHALAARTGQVEFFSASGAVRARNLAVLNAFEDERRPWPDVEKVEGREGITYVLGDGTVRQLMAGARELLDKAGLADDGVADMDVTVGRWGHLDAKGNERESGPGRAAVRLSYAVEGTPLIGPGAKTHLHYDPIGREPALARLFHCHRAVTDIREVATGGTERAFDAFLADSFLEAQYERGGRIVVTAVQAGLLALPADTPQRVAYPALAVEGVVEGLKDQKGDYELRFGRYVPAARPEALRRAGLAVPVPRPTDETDDGPR